MLYYQEFINIAFFFVLGDNYRYFLHGTNIVNHLSLVKLIIIFWLKLSNNISLNKVIM